MMNNKNTEGVKMSKGKKYINQQVDNKSVENVDKILNNCTRAVDKIILSGNVLNKTIHVELYKTFRNVLEKSYKEIEDKFFSQQWIKFALGSEVAYWNSNTSYAIVVKSRYEGANENRKVYFGKHTTEFHKNNIEELFGKSCPSEIMKGIAASKSYDGGHWIGFGKYSYCPEEKRYASWNDDDSIVVDAVKIDIHEFKKNILSEKYTIFEMEIFQKAVGLLKERCILEGVEPSKTISEKEVDNLLSILKIDKTKIEDEVTKKVMNNFTVSSDIIDLYTEEVLLCDKIRADLDVYDKKCLEDVNSGHWELWNNKTLKAKEGQAIVSLDKSLIARNPATDIREDGLIGIDFGTKSTIVSKRDGREKTELLRVGTGQLNKKVVASHYENPTIMEFINLEKFMADYGTRSGRPETQIDDLRVSHIANTDLKSCTISDNFYSFFYDIKQWCGDTERNIKIIDQNGIERVLPAFINLDLKDFNPLELYAYYLGLYINNMRNGIYLDYVLSFPVTYERTVKEKILESFTKGLKKSLPESILENNEIMSKFRVRQGVSEPAAYAITALQGYGFEPDEDENVLYSIFDFGGGTTDFDFGLWRCADENKRDERRYDYVIEHFGSEGDKYLGGENLLELLAFEIFKANADLLGKRKAKNKEQSEESTVGFSFSKPKECDAFPGSETLISNSQEARRNTKQMMEALRPFWEGIIGIDENNKSENITKEINGNIKDENSTSVRDRKSVV